MSLINVKSASCDTWMATKMHEFSKIRQLLDPRTEEGRQKGAEKFARKMLDSLGWPSSDDMIAFIKTLPTYAPAFSPDPIDKNTFDLTYYIDMQWQDEPKVDFQAPSVLHEMIWDNDTDAEDVHNFSTSKKTSISNTTSTTKSNTHKWDIEVGYKLTMKESASMFGLSAESTQEISTKTAYGGIINNTTGQSTTTVTERTWTISEEVKVPPRSKVVAKFLMFEGTLRGTFITSAMVMEGRLVMVDVITEERVYLWDDALLDYLAQVQKITGAVHLTNRVEVDGGFRSEMRTKQLPVD